MAYERKPGEFSLNKNDKGDNPNRPDYRGEGLDLQGNPVEIACWIKEGKNGKWMACSMKPHRDALPKKQASGGRDDSDIPFSQLRKMESSLL